MADKVIELLKKANPQIPFYSINDKEFAQYGKAIYNYDTTKIVLECEKIKMPENGSAYELSVPQLESLDISDKIKSDCFGEMETQVGLCWGYNDMLGGLEYHKSSEINVAVTPMVLLLGLVTDIEAGKYDSKSIKAFYLEKGEMAEVYATTLHFCPCQADEKGFRCVVVLPKGTNAMLDKQPSNDKMLFKKNKWLLCHNKNEALLQRGVYSGIFGENYKITGV